MIVSKRSWADACGRREGSVEEERPVPLCHHLCHALCHPACHHLCQPHATLPGTLPATFRATLHDILTAKSSGGDGCEHSVDEATAEEEIDTGNRGLMIEFIEGKGSDLKLLAEESGTGVRTKGNDCSSEGRAV
ncbi:hypothetical protein WISP_91428 [Willisornis vidua]|uniref:Uncharacterized protein n=1 Tax=Willisornis vidua TaxID=1566151 RepID=A0ABQ9D700_9PASS|nr:hypothetical protein WISP_91428 [Willisornis vidua]